MNIKNRKLISFSFIVIIVIIFAGYIAFKIIFSPSRLKNYFRNTAETVLERKVDIGNARLSPGALILNDIKVRFKDGSRDDNTDSEYFIKCDKMEVKFRMLQLLSKKFVFREIYLKKPVINAVHQPDIKLENLLYEVAGKKTGGIHFDISRVKMVDGEINLYPPVWPDISITDVAINVRKESSHKPVEINIEAGFRNSGLKRMKFTCFVDGLRDIAEIKEFQVEGFMGKMDLTGKIENVTKKPRLKLEYRISDFPEGLLPKNIIWNGYSEITGRIEHQNDRLHVDVRADLTDSQIVYGKYFSKPAGIMLKLQGGFFYFLGIAEVDWYVLNLAGAVFSGTGTIQKNSLALNMIGESIDVKTTVAFSPLLKGYATAGQMNMKGKFSSSLDHPVFSGVFNFKELMIGNFGALTSLYKKITGTEKKTLKFANVKANITVDNSKIDVNHFQSDSGDVAGWFKGRYVWGKKMGFEAHPVIYGKEIGFSISGSTDNIKVSLK